MCKQCEATVSVRGASLSGTALSHACPFRYTQEMLDAIDAADPVTRTHTCNYGGHKEKCLACMEP